MESSHCDQEEFSWVDVYKRLNQCFVNELGLPSIYGLAYLTLI